MSHLAVVKLGFVIDLNEEKTNMLCKTIKIPNFIGSEAYV
jgi:hypothetical protein